MSQSTSYFDDILYYLKTGDLEYWSVGVLECWKEGIEFE